MFGEKGSIYDHMTVTFHAKQEPGVPECRFFNVGYNCVSCKVAIDVAHGPCAGVTTFRAMDAAATSVARVASDRIRTGPTRTTTLDSRFPDLIDMRATYPNPRSALPQVLRCATQPCRPSAASLKKPPNTYVAMAATLAKAFTCVVMRQTPWV